MSNKGSILDILWIGISIFIFAIFLLITQVILREWNTQATNQNFIPEATSIISSGSVGMTAFDYGVIALTMAAIIATIILAFHVGFHPVFFFVGILEITVIFLLIPQFSNIYYNFAKSTSTELTSASATLPMTQTIMNNLPYILAGASFILIIVMYTRWRQGGVSV